MSPSVPSQDEDQHQQCHHDHHSHGSSMSPSVPSQDEDQHQQCHSGHHPHVSRTQLCSQDDDEEDLQQQYCQDDDPNLIVYGRVDTDALSEVNTGKGESMEMINEENIEKKPLNDTAVQEETQTTTIQEESQTGALKPQERVFSQSGRPTVTNIVTGMFPKIQWQLAKLSLLHTV